MSDSEKRIIAKLKKLGLDEESIIPTMLLIKGIEEYQNKLLEYLETTEEITEYELMEKIEKFGFLENNLNIE